VSAAGATDRLVLFAHGSRDSRWRAPFERMLERLQADLGADGVDLAFMEFSPPSLMDAARRAEADGVRTLRILPLFLAGGAHVAKDIPEQVAAVRAIWPHLAIEVLAPVGEDPRFVDLLERIARESASYQGTSEPS